MVRGPHGGVVAAAVRQKMPVFMPIGLAWCRSGFFIEYFPGDNEAISN
jgi:hypothetical protein